MKIAENIFWARGDVVSRGLTDAYAEGIFVCMRTTLNIDDELYASASASTGVKEKTALVRLALEKLIEHQAYERLVALGGTMPGLKMPRRRRSKPARK